MKFETADLSRFLFPDTCLICQSSRIGGSGIPGLCRHCLGRLPWRTRDAVMPWPEDLRQSWPDNLTIQRAQSLQRLVNKSEIIIACDYEQPIRNAILAMKFSDASEWHRMLAGLLEVAIRRQNQRYSAVVAIPLHARRLAQRGYNQALLLAQELARNLDLPDWSAWLKRNRQTDRQSDQPDRQARLANLSGAFSWNGPDNLKAAKVLLVDDVLTTGATLSAAASPLFLTGAEVTGVVVASNHHPPKA